VLVLTNCCVRVCVCVCVCCEGHTAVQFFRMDLFEASGQARPCFFYGRTDGLRIQSAREQERSSKSKSGNRETQRLSFPSTYQHTVELH
jgi:hypothetical protein